MQRRGRRCTAAALRWTRHSLCQHLTVHPLLFRSCDQELFANAVSRTKGWHRPTPRIPGLRRDANSAGPGPFPAAMSRPLSCRSQGQILSGIGRARTANYIARRGPLRLARCGAWRWGQGPRSGGWRTGSAEEPTRHAIVRYRPEPGHRPRHSVRPSRNLTHLAGR